MFGDYFYHAQIRRMVSVFGTLFNNIKVQKKDSNGNILQKNRVPLAYGPRQKFLARVSAQSNLDDPKLAIRLPRLSFEITGLTYDTTTKLQKMNEIRVGTITNNTRKSIKAPSPYRMNIELNIMSKNQDEALQILEQILPYFQPDYTVTINEVPEIGIKSDVPITLTDVTMSDLYEGDFETRRTIIYTLNFETRVKFYGGVSTKDIIRTTISDFFHFDLDRKMIERQTVTTNPAAANPGDTYTEVVTYTMPSLSDAFRFELISLSVDGSFAVGETVTGLTSGASATVTKWTTTGLILEVENPTQYFDLGEQIQGSIGGSTATINTSENLY